MEEEIAYAVVGDNDVRPAIAIKINDRCPRSHRGHLRHDVIELVVQCRSLVNEIYSRGARHFLQIKTVPRQRHLRIQL